MKFIFLFDRELESALHDATLDPSSVKMGRLREAMRQTDIKRNLFEIACLHPQQSICLLAVEALDDLNELKNISETLGTVDVGLAARRRIDHLKNEMKSASKPRYVCPQSYISLEVREELRKAKWPYLEEAYVELPQVGDFEEWAVSEEEVLCQDDVRQLYRVALAASERAVAVSAVRAIHNEYVLAAIAASYEACQDVREIAVCRIQDQTVLMALLDHGLNYDTARAVVDRIPDEPSLTAIARRNRSNALRIYALAKLTDVGVLEDMALCDVDAQVRYAAMLRTDNAALLATVAQQDSDERMRLAAIDRLADKKVLALLAKKEKNRHIRQVAQERLYLLQKTH